MPDEYAVQIVDNEIRFHNLSAQDRAKKHKLSQYKAMIRAKKDAKREKKRQRKMKEAARDCQK